CNPYSTTDQRLPLYSYHPTDNPGGIKWGQTGISNYYAPTNIWRSCRCNDKSPIGCGAVAIAQTLWYFRPNSNYPYSIMPQTSNTCQTPSTSGETSLALLMYNSALAAHTDFNFLTTCNGMTLPGNISLALESMGMTNGGNTSNFNPANLRLELLNGYPAIFYGYDDIDEWHIWTCDGYKRNNYRSYDCDLDGCMEWSYTWYFMNWGWDNDDLTPPTNDGINTTNGYYSSGVFSPYGSSKNYNNGLKMITGLR
ncbi:C10 family peptidase, partial [Algoriphagus sp.]|uniref:C10 family peptidase n=1 Tax=Algoriphagus sp. TaxID=1872435 RepID=UPI0026288CD5